MKAQDMIYAADVVLRLRVDGGAVVEKCRYADRVAGTVLAPGELARVLSVWRDAGALVLALPAQA